MNKAKYSNSEIIRRIITLARPYRYSFIAIFLLIIFSVVVGAIAPKILWQIPDVIIDNIKNRTELNWGLVNYLSLVFIGLVAAVAISSTVVNLILAKVCAKFSANLRLQVFSKLSKVPIMYYNKTKTGELITTIVDDTSVIGETLAIDLSTIFKQALGFATALVMLVLTSFEIMLIGIFIVVLIVVITKIFLPKIRRSQEHLRSIKGKVGGEIEENFTNQSMLYLNNKESEVAEKISANISDLNKAFYNSALLKILNSQISKELAIRVGRTIAWVYGGFSVLSGKMTFGTLQASMQYFNYLVNPVASLIEISASFQETLTSAQRIFKLLDEDEDLLESENKLDLSSIKGEVEFKDINFHYEKIHAIKDFNLKIKPGTKVAIVGPTGSGKTTLVSLLMKFFEPNSGEIIIDGISYEKLTRKQIRSLFGFVLQDAWLSSGNIMDNLTYGNPKISKVDVRNILEDIGINHIFESLPNSYDTKISDTKELLSAGEKQLITIARAIIANPKMIILDEATSNIDTRTELLIQSAIKKLIKNRTTFVIAHRLSTVLDADLIVVIKDGQLIEQGTHTELLSKNGFYTKLYNAQFEEELQEE